MTHERSDAPEMAGPRYEVRDASVSRLLQFGLSLCVVIAVTLFGISRLMAYLTARQPAGQPAPTFATTSDLPPTPRLQTTPRLDLAARRKAEDATLNSYAWIDRSAGTIRIPINRAMDLLVERSRQER